MLVIPETPPVESEANSWLLYDDAEGRFQFRHPQELRLDPRPPDRFTVELATPHPDAGPNSVIIQIPRGTADPQEDLRFRNLEQYRKTVDQFWEKQALDVVRGKEGWLDAEEWKPRRVFLKELAVKGPSAPEEGETVPRLYVDNYFVLGSGSQCLHLQSTSERNDHVAFRKTIEAMIKSFVFGPAAAAAAAAPPAAAAPAPPAAPPATIEPPK